MLNPKEEAVAPSNNASNTKARPGGSRKAAQAKPLDNELELLRDSLGYVHNILKNNSEDMAKSGTLVARLSDSVAKALLAQQKLLAGSDYAATPEAEFDDTLRAMGLGES